MLSSTRDGSMKHVAVQYMLRGMLNLTTDKSVKHATVQYMLSFN